MEMESAYVVEGPLRRAPLPPRSTKYPPMPKRLPARLALSAVAPVQSVDPTRPGVPIWYYNVSVHDGRLEEQLQAQGLNEEQILERSILFSVIGPDAYGLGKAAHFKAEELGWRPLARDPRQAPDPAGTGWRPFRETQQRPRPNPPVPVDVMMQHLMTIRMKLFSGQVPGWLLAWDDKGTAHQPCGLVYGARGLAVGEPCGRPSGCVIAGGGACAWARQALTEGAQGRAPGKVMATNHLIEPIAPAYVSGGGRPPQTGLVQAAATRAPAQPARAGHPAQPAQLGPWQQPAQPQVASVQQPALAWQPTGAAAAPRAAPPNGSGSVSWPAPSAPHPAHAPAPAPPPPPVPLAPAPPAPTPPPPLAAAPVPADPEPQFLVEPTPPLTW